MRFQRAQNKLLNGKRLKRDSWQQDEYLELMHDKKRSTSVAKNSGAIAWTGSKEDFEADDWSVIN